MDKQFYEYLLKTKQEKLTEKAFYAHITKSVTLILLCMFLMTFAAYAFFEASVGSKDNIITAGEFKVDISIENESVEISVQEPEVTDEEVTVNSRTEESETSQPVIVKTIVRDHIELEKTGQNEYKGTLKKGKNIVTLSYDCYDNIGTGFCIFKIDSCDYTYFTGQLGTDTLVTDGYVEKISFVLNLPADADVRILTHWGTSSYYGYNATSFFSSEISDTCFVLDNDIVDVDIPVPDTPDQIEDTPKENTDATTGNDAEEEQTETKDEAPATSVTVEYGDSLYELAIEYNTTVDMLVAYNNIDDRTHIEPGQIINIPPADWTIPEEEPSTEKPSTEEPTTEEPTTEEPTTEEPSPEEPSTEEPSTEEPSTEEPSTEEPSTEEPSTEEPSTEEPSTEELTTEELTTEELTTEELTTEELTTEEPSTEEPLTEEPSAEVI